jgi:hypothetical protein
VFEYISKTKLKVMMLACCMLLSTVLVVQAASSTTVTRSNFLPGVSAKGVMTSLQSPESQNGFCQVRSYTSPSTNINVIGWTYWQCDLLQNGNIIVSQGFSGAVSTNANNKSQSLSWAGAFSQSGRGLRAWGTHDFNHSGSNPSPWRPNNSNTYP